MNYNATEEVKRILEFLINFENDDAIVAFYNYLEDHDWSSEAQQLLLGVSVDNLLRFGEFSKAFKLSCTLGDICPDDDYYPEIGCSEEQFLMRKVIYGVFISQCMDFVAKCIALDFPGQWEDCFHGDFYDIFEYYIDKDAVIEAIKTIVNSI